jgi:2,3-bisphosphoglycerate-independent phosphoglycerate mutase
VPLLYVNDADTEAHVRAGGRICDVAPTMLALLGIPKPAVMTGVDLLERFQSPFGVSARKRDL